ncbi:MAG TPA: hypothetical protein VN816_00920 [Acidimicrobiales bacterium]|nr:hypothetical protein [Acidimicrobiales bacterium]
MSTAFVVVFALFVAAMVGLAVTAVRWGVRRDRAARAESSRQDEAPRP